MGLISITNLRSGLGDVDFAGVKQKAPFVKDLAKLLGGGLAQAFDKSTHPQSAALATIWRSLSPNQQQQLEERSGVAASLWWNLSKEINASLYAQALLRLAVVVELHGDPRLAQNIFAYLRDGENFPKEVRSQAQVKFKVSQGRGPLALRASRYLRMLPRELSRPELLVGLLAGPMAFELGQALSLRAAWHWGVRGWGARMGAGVLGVSAEATVWSGSLASFAKTRPAGDYAHLWSGAFWTTGAFRILGGGLVWAGQGFKGTAVGNALAKLPIGLRREVGAYTGVLGVQALEVGVHLGAYHAPHDLWLGSFSNYFTLRLGQSLLSGFGGAQLMAKNHILAKRLQGPPPSFKNLTGPHFRTGRSFAVETVHATVGQPGHIMGNVATSSLSTKNARLFRAPLLAQGEFGSSARPQAGSPRLVELAEQTPILLQNTGALVPRTEMIFRDLAKGDIHIRLALAGKHAQGSTKPVLWQTYFKARLSKVPLAQRFVLISDGEGVTRLVLHSPQGQKQFQELALDKTPQERVPSVGSTSLGRITTARRAVSVSRNQGASPRPKHPNIATGEANGGPATVANSLRAARASFAKASGHWRRAVEAGSGSGEYAAAAPAESFEGALPPPATKRFSPKGLKSTDSAAEVQARTVSHLTSLIERIVTRMNQTQAVGDMRLRYSGEAPLSENMLRQIPVLNSLPTGRGSRLIVVDSLVSPKREFTIERSLGGELFIRTSY